VSFIVEPGVEAYAEEHATPLPELFDRLAAETREKTTAPQMMVGRVEGRFLGFLVRLRQARRILELGTFTGYSSICMALELPEEGLVITCDVDEETTEIARRYAAEAGVVDRIEYRLGPAAETLAELDGPFDLVFIDAWKGDYPHYYEAVLPKLTPRGLIVCDNVLWGGDVVNPAPDDDNGLALAAFNDLVQDDQRVANALLTVGDGLLLIWRAA
jgi:caffeoyl-CoA O-methyltransferase